MRTIKRVSFALLTTPLFFIGCVQEKVSTIIPAKSTDNRVIIDSNETNASMESNLTLFNRQIMEPPKQNLTLPSLKNNLVLTIPTQHINAIMSTSPQSTFSNNPIDTLALAVQANINTELSGKKGTTTKALEVGENWNVITKEDEVLETAKEFLGVKYVWAANGPESFDCSGFTKYVFEKHGVKLPRYSGYQAKVGTKVAYNELEKGDLVFFDTDKKGKVNHVGIYLGDNQFIHASSGGKKVMITSFIKKKFYKRRFLHGQRVLNTNTSL